MTQAFAPSVCTFLQHTSWVKHLIRCVGVTATCSRQMQNILRAVFFYQLLFNSVDWVGCIWQVKLGFPSRVARSSCNDHKQQCLCAGLMNIWNLLRRVWILRHHKIPPSLADHMCQGVILVPGKFVSLNVLPFCEGTFAVVVVAGNRHHPN